jgi:tRNA(adenine34) deaminase
MDTSYLSLEDKEVAEQYIRTSMEEAQYAAKTGNRPYGAVIAYPSGGIAVKEHNRVKELIDPSAHAEINAIRSLCKQLNTTKLRGFKMYVNVEPCPMCFTCMIEARIAEVYYGAFSSLKLDFHVEKIAQSFGHQIKIYGGILAEETEAHKRRLLANFNI